jgi:hypothetical protein
MPDPAKFAYWESQNNEKSILKNPHYTVPHRLGPQNVECSRFKALHYEEEITGPRKPGAPVALSTCCQKDKVTLPYIDKNARAFPPVLQAMFQGNKPGMYSALTSWL